MPPVVFVCLEEMLQCTKEMLGYSRDMPGCPCVKLSSSTLVLGCSGNVLVCLQDKTLFCREDCVLLKGA